MIDDTFIIELPKDCQVSGYFLVARDNDLTKLLFALSYSGYEVYEVGIKQAGVIVELKPKVNNVTYTIKHTEPS